MSRAARIRRLSGRDWATLAAAALWLPFTGLMLRFRSVQQCREVLSRLAAWLPGGPLPEPESLVEAQRIARMVQIAARNGPYRAACLPRSLVTEMLLTRRGIECVVRFGVRTDQEAFGAHAWVEAGGQPLAEPGSEDPGLQVLN